VSIGVCWEKQDMFSLRNAFKRTTCWSARVWFVGLALAWASLGCGGGEVGPERVAVEGVVTLDGQKLKEGVVRFIPAATGKGAAPATMATVKDGVFQLPRAEGPIVGKHRIEIESTGHYGFEIDDESAYAKSFDEKKKDPLPPNPIPEIYNSKSTLTVEVKADGENKFEFSLQSSVTKQ
jgi:hypothetical protein